MEYSIKYMELIKYGIFMYVFNILKYLSVLFYLDSKYFNIQL